MTSPRSRIAEKLHVIGAAQDGARPDGVTPTELANLGTDSRTTIESELEEMVADDQIPLEECSTGRYRFVTMEEGKKYKIQLKPIHWWLP